MSANTAKRSRNGCWTCKRRRRKCDETRPTCTNCADHDLTCEGYEPRLQWGVGVASRGHLTGATLPSIEHTPVRQKGRQRDLLKQGKERMLSPTMVISSMVENIQQDSSSPPSTLSDIGTPSDPVLSPLSLRSMQKETLFQDFLSSGVKQLHSTDINSNPLVPILPSLCQRSEALYDVCVAYQAYLSHGTDSLFYELYSEALSSFRASIDHPLMKTDTAILNAALMLCTIGILQGTPWTVHIKGMERLLDERAALSPLADPEPELTQAIEVMGIFDLRPFVIGRQNPSLNVWRRYRQGQLIQSDHEIDSVEVVSGIPRSLIDMLSLEDGELTEEHLWLWPGCEGTLLQCQLWEAYKYAIMLDIRRRKRRASISIPHQSPIQAPRLKLPSDAVLLTKALSALDAVHNGANLPAAAESLVLNAVIYPLFLVGVEVFTSDNQEQQDLVSAWFDQRLKSDPFANAQQAWDILQTIFSNHQDGKYVTADEIARFRQIEVALI